jgi:hypothetical protein
VVPDQERQEVHMVDENTELFHKRLAVEEIVGS